MFVLLFYFCLHGSNKSISYGGLDILNSFCGGFDFRSRFKHIILLRRRRTKPSANPHVSNHKKTLVRILGGEGGDTSAQCVPQAEFWRTLKSPVFNQECCPTEATILSHLRPPKCITPSPIAPATRPNSSNFTEPKNKTAKIDFWQHVRRKQRFSLI